MSLINLSLIFIAGFDLGMTILIYLLNPKNRINIFIALTTLSIAAWTLGVAMFRNAETESQAWFWACIQNGFGSIIPVLLFFVSIYFPYQSLKLKLWQISLIIFSVICITFIAIAPGFWVKSINLNVPDNSYDINRFGIVYFNIHFYFYLVSAYIIFLKKFRKSGGIIKKQLSYFIFSTVILAIFGSVFAVIIPLIFNQLGPYWIGPYFGLPTMLILLRFILISNKS